jgi:uncharacterized ferritin-like protein (DUF455 family)
MSRPQAPLEERFEALERVFGFMVEALSDTTSTIHLRLLALQEVLEAKGVLTDPEVAARIQALSDVAELELEYGDRPELEQFRQLRRFVKGKLEQPPEGD